MIMNLLDSSKEMSSMLLDRLLGPCCPTCGERVFARDLPSHSRQHAETHYNCEVL